MSTAHLQAPSRAIDTQARSPKEGCLATIQHSLPSVLKVTPRQVCRRRECASRGRFAVPPVPLGGVRPLQCRRLHSAFGVELPTATVGDEYDLGWPRGFDELFEVLNEVLGEGAFGIVKAVRHRVTGKRFAAKMLPKSRGKKGNWEGYAAMLQKEVSLWTAVQNSHDKHIVQLRGVFEDDDYVYLVQDICEGGDLHRLLKERKTLDEREAAQAIAGVLFMLAAAHDRNICFGDVKPANFLLETQYPCRRHLVDPSAPKGDLVVKGVDFGCSQKVNDGSKLAKRTGTPLYMAPEIFFGWYGLEVDIWAAGMMLYQLLCGKLPFFGERAEELKNGPKFLIVEALMDNELEFTGELWTAISDDAKDLISKMLDVEYNTRISARAALQHSWIQRYCEHPAVVFTQKEGITNNVIDLPGSPGTPVSRNSGIDGEKGGAGGML